MTLQHLVGRNLDRIEPSAETINRLLDAAARHIADARVVAVSAETRFTSAYTAVRMLADIGLHANGYRTRSSVPGHHVIAIESLVSTLGTDARIVARLDHLRKLRNAAEYSGDLIPESAVSECLLQAEALHTRTRNWLRKHKPALLRAVKT
jgi:hypothetical protein